MNVRARTSRRVTKRSGNEATTTLKAMNTFSCSVCFVTRNVILCAFTAENVQPSEIKTGMSLHFGFVVFTIFVTICSVLVKFANANGEFWLLISLGRIALMLEIEPDFLSFLYIQNRE